MQNRLLSLLENRTAAPHVAVGFSDKIDRSTNLDGLDVAELRIDLYSDTSPEYVKTQISKFSNVPTIATIRTKKEGGNWNGSDKTRLELFKEIISHVDAIDIELVSTDILDEVVALAKKHGKQTIISYHNFDKTPSEKDLDKVINSAFSAGADIVKIAAQVGDDTTDVHTLTKILLNHKDKKLIVIGMGSKGSATRVIFPLYGSLLTFAFIGSSTAPGQLPLQSLIGQLRLLYPRYNERVIIENQLLECA